MTFDPYNIPKDHRPYAADEMKNFRAQPLAIQAPAMRATLVGKISTKTE